MIKQPMKALTLWQPWATAILLGLKQYETRSWDTDYRGPLVIHAAARPVNRYECNETIVEALKAAGYTSPASFPLGVGLCVVELAGCHFTDLIAPKVSDLERAFGDYSPGRFAWRLEDIRPFPEPIPARGYQQLWNWDAREETRAKPITAPKKQQVQVIKQPSLFEF